MMSTPNKSNCSAIISTITVEVDYGFGYQAYNTLPSLNQPATKRWTGLSEGDYRVSIQYDGGNCVGVTDVIDITILNQIITTSSTTTTNSLGPGGPGGPGPRGLSPGGPPQP